MRLGVVCVLLLLVGCGRDLITGEVIATTPCQDVQVPYVTQVAVEKEVQVVREEVHFEPEPYRGEECNLVAHVYTIFDEVEKEWTASDPFCMHTFWVKNEEVASGLFLVQDVITVNGQPEAQQKQVTLGPAEEQEVQFLVQCVQQDVVQFGPIEVDAPRLEKCETVTKFRSRSITRLVNATEFRTVFENVTKYRVERVCE